MGMRSAEGAPGTKTGAASGTEGIAGAEGAAGRPPLLLMAAAVQGLEALGLCVVMVANVIDAVSGQAYQSSSAIALIVVEVITAVAVGWVAYGIARVLPWSRTPAVMTQVFTAMIALWLLEAHRYFWGSPALLLAIAGLAGLFAPTSLQALHRSASPRGTTPR